MRSIIPMIFAILLSLSAIAGDASVHSILSRLENFEGIKIKSLHYEAGGKTHYLEVDKSGNIKSSREGNFLMAKEFKMFMEQMEEGLDGGSRVGNGGDILICKEGNYVLDHYLAKNDFAENIKFTLAQDISINRIIERLLATVPHLGISLERFLKNFKQRQEFSDRVFWNPEGQLIDIKDEDLVTKLPKDCNLVQAVIRVKSQRTIYFYDKSAMDSIINDSSKLSWLLVHEWLWDYFDRAIDVREVNQYLHSDRFINSDLESQVQKTLNSYSFKISNNQLKTRFRTLNETTVYGLAKVDAMIQNFDFTGGESSRKNFLRLVHTINKSKLATYLGNEKKWNKVVRMLKDVVFFVKNIESISSLERNLVRQIDNSLSGADPVSVIKHLKVYGNTYKTQMTSFTDKISISLMSKEPILPWSKKKFHDRLRSSLKFCHEVETLPDECSNALYNAAK